MAGNSGRIKRLSEYTGCVVLRLIASDLDGTLFGSDHLPAPRTAAAVNAVVDAGYIFAAVTGRSHFGGANRVTATGATAHWFIGSNGGHRLNMANGELEERLLFTRGDVYAMLTDLPRQLGAVGFGFEHQTGFSYDDTFRLRYPEAFDGGPRRDSAIWADDDIGKIFITHPELSSDELIRMATALAPAGTHVSTSGSTFVELTPAGGDKGLGLARLCRKLGVAASDVIAFGDNNNDLSMLEWAGRGIAMANATTQALTAADEVTATNVDFGVAIVLESLL